MTRPLTLSAWIVELRRRGVTVRLVGGAIRVRGVRRLAAGERIALANAGPQVRAFLEARAERRQRRKVEKPKEQNVAEPTSQRSRRVIGMIANPGGPLRLLYADEVTEIDVRRARVIGVMPWRAR